MKKRTINIKSGKHECQMEITQKQYDEYYRPWWCQKQKEHRNRESMKEKGYTSESYEKWKIGIADSDGLINVSEDSIEDIVENKMKLELLNEALSTLMPEEKEIAVQVLGEKISLSEYAKVKNKPRTTLSDKKKKVMKKLKHFFTTHGYEVKQE